jgi:prephenate dehydratase
VTATVSVVGYPGPEGTHSDAAATILAPAGAATIGLPTFTAVIEATAAAEVGLGVLPIESSLVGPIAETHDLLYRAPLSIVREATLPIRHCLLGLAGTKVEDVRVVRSHPAALDQCRALLARLPVESVPAATTAEAARRVASGGDPAEAAIASVEAAETHGLAVLADNIGDHPEAYTRFVAVAPYTLIGRQDGWRTALSFATDHRPGALFRALEPFARHDVNLVQLVSRPLPETPFRYRFDLVLDGHVFDAELRGALQEVRAQARSLRLFGSYPAEERAES